MQSYYEILEIAPTATKEEIKKQYKKLVRMYHPDVNSSIEAEVIFKNITKASEILLDDEKRKNYDLLRNANKKVKEDYSNFKKNNSSNCTFSDLFQKQRKKEKEIKNKPKNGEDITINIDIDLNEALLGSYRTVNIATSSVCPKCEGYKFSNGQKCSVCDGKGEITKNKKITVKIPSMIKDKTKLRIKNEGKLGQYGGKNGNLYIIVNIHNNQDLKIENGIVYYDAQISPYVAVLGGNIKVPTLFGQATIKIPPLTKTNQTFRLIDVGVMNEKTHKKGDQIVRIFIQIPKDISEEEILLYEKLKRINLKKKNAYHF